MKVLLMSPPVHSSINSMSMNNMPTTAIYLLSAVLQSHGHEVTVLDNYYMRKFNPIESNIDDFFNYLFPFINETELIGISSNTLNWSMSKFVLKRIKKEFPDIPVVLGGLHPSYFPDYIMQSTECDFILTGEGEITLPQLAKKIQDEGTHANFEDIDNLYWRSDGRIISNKCAPLLSTDVLERMPLPDFNQMPSDVYSIMPISTSRGCRFGCKFCSVPRKFNWVGHNEQYVIEKISELWDLYHDRFTHKAIYFTDDCFTADACRATNILSGVLGKESDLDSIILEARANDLRSSILLEHLHDKRIKRIAVGVESGTNAGLKKINKGLTIEQLELTLKYMEKYDIVSKGYFSFIIGFPWDTLETCMETIEYAASIVQRYGPGLVNLNWHFLFPSQIWSERKNYGIDLTESIFDNFYYLTDPYVARAIRPNMREYEINYIQDKLSHYADLGYSLQNG